MTLGIEARRVESVLSKNRISRWSHEWKTKCRTFSCGLCLRVAHVIFQLRFQLTWGALWRWSSRFRINCVCCIATITRIFVKLLPDCGFCFWGCRWLRKMDALTLSMKTPHLLRFFRHTLQPRYMTYQQSQQHTVDCWRVMVADCM